ncbi:MAG: hypothetical protein ABI893_06605 [Polaromonas sp.]|uniref:hypothetical protein n=1 Tax=Polaromonas sp. TaxID=1869339 RepID=UPI0032677815
MPKALITAVLAASLAAASAAYASPPLPTAQSLAAPAGNASMGEKNTRLKLQTGAETVKVRAVYSPDVRANPSTDEPDAGESGWRSYGMLLATLVLMGVIAVRRFTTGRP